VNVFPLTEKWFHVQQKKSRELADILRESQEFEQQVPTMETRNSNPAISIHI